MRLLFLSNVFPSPLHPTKGVFNLGLVRGLADLGHELAVIAPLAWTEWIRAPRTRRQELRQQGGIWKGVPVSYPVYFYTPGTLRRAYGHFMWYSIRATVQEVIARHRPQAVVSYWAHPDGYCAVQIARVAGIPAIAMVGGSDMLLLTANKSRRRMIQQVLERADAVVTVNQDLKNKVIASGLDGAKVHVVRRGIDTERFHPGDREDARRRLKLPVKGQILLWVGRMEPVKGLPVLLAALQQLKENGVDCETLLVGGGGLSGAIGAEAKQRGLESNVRVIGAVSHELLADYYRAANLFVLPSLSEGVPNVLLESMACGTPFVASDVGGISEVATPGVDRLVPAGDPQALAAAIREHLTSSSGESQRKFFPDDWPKAASRLVEVIQPMIDQTLTSHLKDNGACLTTSNA